VNCWYAPTGMEGFVGVTVMELKTGGATVTVVCPLTDP